MLNNAVDFSNIFLQLLRQMPTIVNNTSSDPGSFCSQLVKVITNVMPAYKVTSEALQSCSSSVTPEIQSKLRDVFSQVTDCASFIHSIQQYIPKNVNFLRDLICIWYNPGALQLKKEASASPGVQLGGKTRKTRWRTSCTPEVLDLDRLKKHFYSSRNLSRRLYKRSCGSALSVQVCGDVWVLTKWVFVLQSKVSRHLPPVTTPHSFGTPRGV